MAVDAAVIRATQDSLGLYVKKPPLTEKLLNKPPFRFLHDVFTVVIKDTGVLAGLLEEHEMVSDNVKDKDAKVEFLTKIIDTLSLASGDTLAVKPGKIASGQEADKTNEMLQVLASLVANKVDTSEAVRRVKAGEKPGKTKKKKPKEEEKRKDKSPEKITRQRSRDRDKENKVQNKENKKNSQSPNKTPNKSPSKASPKKSRTPSPPPDIMAGLSNGHSPDPPEDKRLAEAEAGVAEEQEEQEEEHVVPVPPTSTSTRPRTSGGRKPVKAKRNPELSRENSEEAPVATNGPQVLGSSPPPSSPPTSGRPTTGRQGSARPKTGRARTARPPSARPAAPRIRERQATVEEQPRPQTAKVANVILDNDDENEDDGEEFLIEEAPKDPLLSLENDHSVEVAAVESGGEQHGALVQQILETQKELQDGNKRQEARKATEIEREAGVGEGGRSRDREATQREVDKLRGSIQTLTRSANPLGKLMDFLQEDVDSMQRELEQWRKENKSLQLEVRHEENMTAQTLQPLSVHLTELTAAVNEQLDKISMVKSNIIKNEDKIEKMVSSIGVTHQ